MCVIMLGWVEAIISGILLWNWLIGGVIPYMEDNMLFVNRIVMVCYQTLMTCMMISRPYEIFPI